MVTSVEHGLLNGPPLEILESLLDLFYLPLLKAAAQRGGVLSASRATTPGGAAGRSASVLSHVTERNDTRLVIRDEFIMNVDKFHRHVKRTIDQVKGEVRLEIPTSSIGHDVKTVLKDVNLVTSLEEAMEKWEKQISVAIEEQLKRVPPGQRTARRNRFLARAQRGAQRSIRATPTAQSAENSRRTQSRRRGDSDELRIQFSAN